MSFVIVLLLNFSKNCGVCPVKWILAVFSVFFLVACVDQPSVSFAPTPLPTTVVNLPTPPPLPTAILPTATAVPWCVGVDTAVPLPIYEQIQQMSELQNGQFLLTEDGVTDVRLVLNDGERVGAWVLALVAAFPTVQDGMTLEEVRGLWESGELVVNGETAVLLTAFWGESSSLRIVTDVTDELWQDRTAVGVVSFDALTPELKVLAIDGQSPLRTDFEADEYALTVPIGLVGDETAVAEFRALLPLQLTNRDSGELTRVAMTGVTALTRATAWQMEVNGVLWPGTAVAPILRSADIAHISNEVSFAPNCPFPQQTGGTTFCSRDAYFELLVDLGIDVVELTGNHLNDYGRENVAHSLTLYEEAGMQTFGGGGNVAEAAMPALFEHHGNRIAFVGCNSAGPNYAWATVELAGARPCDEAFFEQIAVLRADGYLVLTTLQYSEYYHYASTTVQREAFARVAAAGATAVSGSQGHHVQGFAFVKGVFVHYGLGNLFFDQMELLGTRQTFIDGYVIYNGRLLSVELWTGLIENWCCPREMAAWEREGMLTAVFGASDWEQ